jgi:hypothetical protein
MSGREVNKTLKIMLIVIGSLIILWVLASTYLINNTLEINHLEEDAACSKANGGKPCF